jgi:hypothetical protein
MKTFYLNKIKDNTDEGVCSKCIVSVKNWREINCNRLACLKENCHYSEGTKEKHDLIIEVME